jgi:uncharacterized protein YunC (DUF1805 family)
MITEKRIKIKDKNVTGIEIRLQNANLVLVITEKGYIFCGYLNLNTAEKLGDVASVVTGIKTVKDLLEAEIVALTSKAKDLGIKKGMLAREAIERYL